MTKFEEVRAVVASELGIPDQDVKPHSSFVSLGADSMDFQSLILSLEEELGIEIPEDDAKKLFTPQDVVDYAENHL